MPDAVNSNLHTIQVLEHMWYNVACANGNKIGADNRAIIEKEMTSAQISEAQKLAREWMSRRR